MGISINAQCEENGEYIKAVKDMLDILFNRMFSLLWQSDFLYRFSSLYQLQKKSLEIMHKVTNTVIRERKMEKRARDRSTDERTEDDFGKKRKLAFLDLLLETTIDGQPLPDENITEEVDTFMFEGHHTVSAGLSFALHSIANHQDIQDKIVEELKTIFADDPKRPPTYRDLQDMKYLEMVIKESLRLYPPVPAYTRHLEEDLDFGDFIMPKGGTTVALAYTVHRDPNYFPDPDRFIPERFNTENTGQRHPYAYLPFSAGPRNCIGQKFALLEMKTAISKVLRNYKLLPGGPEPVLAMEAILKSASGICLRIENRKF